VALRPIFALALAGLTGCSTYAARAPGEVPRVSSRDADERLDGTIWRVVRLGNDAPSAPAVISFGKSGVSGSLGCNRINGPYRVTGRRLRIGALAMTQMACAPAAMAQEQDYARFLDRDLTIMRSADGGSLALTAAHGLTLRLVTNAP
jgi:heat shock protein HslJ